MRECKRAIRGTLVDKRAFANICLEQESKSWLREMNH